MATDSAMGIENAEDLGQGPKGTAALWSQEIAASRKFLDKFKESAVKINSRYIDKRTASEEGEFRVNLFWSTIQVVMSMLYAQPPKSTVKRLYDDFSDDTSRVGAQIIERILNNDIQEDGSTSSAAIRYAIQDWVTLGLGQVWARYSVNTEMQEYAAVTDPVSGVELAPAGQFERILDEDAPVEYVHWDDFLYSPCRIWEECRWVARRAYMTREQLIARFGEEVGKQVPINKPSASPTDSKGQKVDLPKDPWQRAAVWEIWDKRTKKVVWYSEGCDFLLDERDDPLKLKDFWPCPPPMIANTTTLEYIPRSDFILAQDQFDQLDEINTRISWLTRAMKVVGVYDKSAEGVQRMLSQAVENQLIPVDNWAMFAESGGMKNKIDWLPVGDIANVIEKLVMLREGVKGQIYEVLGISDIMRGNTKASETMGAQQLKAQFGSTRIQLKQFYVAKFVQKALGIKAEIISMHFQPETIAKRSNIMASPDAKFAPQAIELIKNPEEAKYRVTVLADSLAHIDQKAENESRMGALTALGQFLQQASNAAKEVPGSAPMLLEMAKWFMAGFKGFQSIEGVFDQAISAAQKEMSMPQQPNPMMVAEVEEMQAKTIERKASAVQKLADAEAKTIGAMLPFPAPPEQFIGGMPGQGMPMPQQGGLPPNVMPPNGLPPGAMPPMPSMPPQMPSAPPMPPTAGQPNQGLPPAIQGV